MFIFTQFGKNFEEKIPQQRDTSPIGVVMLGWGVVGVLFGWGWGLAGVLIVWVVWSWAWIGLGIRYQFSSVSSPSYQKGLIILSEFKKSCTVLCTKVCRCDIANKQSRKQTSNQTNKTIDSMMSNNIKHKIYEERL